VGVAALLALTWPWIRKRVLVVSMAVGKPLNGMSLKQGCPTLLLPIDCPAQFISNPNQTHLKQPIKVFRIT